MSKRKAISTRTRFEIFKRDRFACQYCGRTPPEVVLHLDHVIPVADGGSNKEGNLITSCMECNLGKADVPLGSVRPVPKFDIALQREKLKQLEEMNEFLAHEKRILDEVVDSIGRHWMNCNCLPQFKNLYTFNANQASSVRRFLERLSIEQIYRAIDITWSRKKNDREAWLYFCGICWNMIKEGKRG